MADVEGITREISARKNGKAQAALEFSNVFPQGVTAGVVGARSIINPVLSVVWQLFLLPVAALLELVTAIFAIREAILKRNDGFFAFKAVTITLFALALIAAAVGAIVATGVFAIAAPAIYASVIAGHALLNFVSAIYFAARASRATDPLINADYKAQAKHALLEGVAGAFVTGALAVITFVASPIAYGVALTVWMVAASIAAGFAMREYQRLDRECDAMLKREVSDSDTTNNAAMTNKLNNLLTQTPKRPEARAVPKDEPVKLSDAAAPAPASTPASVAPAAKAEAPKSSAVTTKPESTAKSPANTAPEPEQKRAGGYFGRR